MEVCVCLRDDRCSTIPLRKGDAAAVRRALGGLPPPLREVIILREFEQLTYKEICGDCRRSQRYRNVTAVPCKQLEWTLDGRLRTTTRRHSLPTRYKLWNQIV